ncbi:MAG: T9SS type A sorting domain-containing protein, partial [Planctomycetota bacterium]
ELVTLGLAYCIDRIDIATEGYIFDGSNTDFGNFVTYNSLTGGGVDDSDHDYNGTDGRVIMQFEPMCIQDINVRHVMLEFMDKGCATIELGNMNGTDDGSTDCNGDPCDTFDVLDIVILANCVLAGDCSQDCPTAPNGCFACAGDINQDGGYNVLDIVQLANCVLAQNCGGRVDDATESKIIMIDNVVSIEADGFVGGVQMTLQHGADFSIKMTDQAQYADYLTSEYETRLLVITPETDELFSYSGDFKITEVIVANSQNEVPTSLPTSYHLSVAYPNPFNPVTTMGLTIPEPGNVSVQVYNLTGQVVATLASGYMDANTYTLTWDASEISSGIYFVKAQVDGFATTQKLMLVK